jgi:selenocysteine lyase/cysteine desulfurase
MKDPLNAYRAGIIGIERDIPSPNGAPNRIVYADWTASGRNYQPIEARIQNAFMPLVGNTHTETSTTGTAMTHAYHQAQQLIKRHVNACPEDVIITATSGMTRLINKFQRIIGVKSNGSQKRSIPESEKPVVFITHMEHHSNQTSWLETDTTVAVIEPNGEGLVDLDHFRELLETYRDRSLKIASVTACSNVTGIETPYHEIARIIHEAGGYCFVDFACSAPYVDIDMHPNEAEALDAIFFSPHKFLGGPGSAGVLVFHSQLYHRSVPDHPGGGTVDWTNPWGGHKYVDDIEAREDGGTPPFLQTIKTALCIRLKEEMGVENIMAREHELLNRLWDQVEDIPGLHILAPKHRNRLAILSFYLEGIHHNLAVRLLNDRFGIQCRGGCSCAGTYGHYLLHVDPEQSRQITERINAGDYSMKPGWIRVSLHPTMTEAEVDFIAKSLRELVQHHQAWSQAYLFQPACNLLTHANEDLDKEVKAQMEWAFEETLLPVEEKVGK